MSTNNSNASSGPSSHASNDNYSNPFYLHPSNNPGNVLIPSLLDGDNYHTWSRAMQMALTAKNKLGFIDGSVKQLDASSPNHGSWSRCNMMVLSWLFNAISKDLRDSIIYLDTAATLWTDLNERFSQGNATKVYRIRRDIINHSQASYLFPPIIPS
ncbi:hypothetical protein MRB53_028549 [Persea americana]|uniref:Uncharacterized protein n=1 Tax=Persea americana TaxID=3435 RepID=A0ACC2KGD5_PERAE|nr:hypothetical protein MRB53_028549 [Persea americana]